MADAFRARFGPEHGVDLELPERQLIRPPRFSGTLPRADLAS
jgi:hypothetical protein